MEKTEKFEIRMVEGTQKGRKMYVGLVKAEDLCLLNDDGEYAFRSDIYDHIKNPKGYQRLFEPRRADSFCKFMGYTPPKSEQNMATFSPTTILVNIRAEDRKNIEIKNDRIVVKRNAVLWIVDGQARIEGIRQLLKEKKDLDTYEEFAKMDVSIVVTELTSNLEEAIVFAILNKMQIGVKYDLVDQVLKEQVDAGDVTAKRLATVYDAAGIKIFKNVEERITASRIAQELNGINDSPWYENIKIANEQSSESKGKIIRERSFTLSLAPLVDELKNNFNVSDEDIIKHIKLLWNGLRAVMPEAFEPETKKSYVIQKSTGTSVMHNVYIPLLSAISNNRIVVLSQDEFVNGLRAIKEFIGHDPARNFLDAEYWRSETGRAGMAGTSAKSFDMLSKEIRGLIQSFMEKGGKS